QTAMLVAQKKYSAALDALRSLVMHHPELASVHFQLAALLARTGRIDEAVRAFNGLAALRSDDPEVPAALASTLLRARRIDDAFVPGDRAVVRSGEWMGARVKAPAHETAARAALGRDDPEAAITQAAAGQKADPPLPMTPFVTGRLAYDAGRYEDALASFKQ